MKAATTVLVFCVAALLALGTVMLYSSPVGARLVVQQATWLTLGLLLCIAAATVDYRNLKKLSWVFYILALLLLIAVLASGQYINGARRWIKWNSFSLQPSELAKLALIFAIAHYTERYHRQMPSFKRGLLVPCLFIAPMLALIFVEPDYGTTVLLAGVSAVMLIIAGVRLTMIAPAVLVGILLVGSAVLHNENRLGRVKAFLDPQAHKEGKGFQQYQAAVALGSGGVTGVGLGDGRQKHHYIPEHHTDFILSIVGEELGLVATLSVVLAFLAIVFSGVYISVHASDRFGSLLGCGITFLIGLQAFINMGVVATILPNKGLPLPFVSYGGSSLLTMLASIGLLLNVARHANEPVSRAKFNPFNPQHLPSTQLS